jgi:hypothetical protein
MGLVCQKELGRFKELSCVTIGMTTKNGIIHRNALSKKNSPSFAEAMSHISYEPLKLNVST